MTWLSCIHAEVILFVFVPDDGGRPKHVVQDNKTNKLVKAYLIDLWTESCVDWSVFEKVIRHNRMQT
jgi:hypothetical protein